MILIMRLLSKMQRTCSDKHLSDCLPLSYIFLQDSWYLSNHIDLITPNGSKNDALGIYHSRPGARVMTPFSLMADLKANKHPGTGAACFCLDIHNSEWAGKGLGNPALISMDFFWIDIHTLINCMDSKECQKSRGLLSAQGWCLCIPWGQEKAILSQTGGKGADLAAVAHYL